MLRFRPMDEKKDSKGGPGNAQKKLGDGTDHEKNEAVLIGEIVGASPGSTININILLAGVTKKAETSQEAMENAEKALELARKYEDHNLEVFKKRSAALIEFKKCDPDEIEKRSNNSTRRILKMVVALSAIGGMGGMLVCAALGANILVCGLCGLIGAIALATLAPLASGESVSSGDVVKVIQALGSTVKGMVATESEDNKGRKRNR